MMKTNVIRTALSVIGVNKERKNDPKRSFFDKKWAKKAKM